MPTPRVVLRSKINGHEYTMTNVAVSPYRYEFDMDIPGNPSESNNATHEFDLVSNGKFTGRVAKITVLTPQVMSDLVAAVNELEDYLNWETPDGEIPVEPLDINTVTVPMIIERVHALDNASDWGTFDDPVKPVPYGIDLASLLAKLTEIRESVTWI